MVLAIAGGLKTINLPDKLTSLGKYAFWNCTSLNGIVIPEGVTNIGENTFFCCESLKSITIKNPKCEIYGYNLLYNYNNTICDKYDEVNEEYIYTGIITVMKIQQLRLMQKNVI